MSLRRYFHPTIWSRGQEYYHSDLVTDFKAEGTHFSAKVQGTRPYDVMLNVSDDNLYKARCSCPYAADGSFCKHEAALAARVQFYLGHERRISAVTVHPFGPEPKDDGKDRSGFFDLDVSCRRLEVKENDLALAENFISSGKTEISSLGSDYGGVFDENEALRIEGTVSDAYDTIRVSAIVGRKQLIRVQCSEYACYGRNSGYYSVAGCCPHVLALLLMARQRLRERPFSYGTSRTGRYLMSFFDGDRGAVQPQDRQPVVRLEPRVASADSGRIFVDFRCGTEKLYLIKNAAALFGAESRREVFETDTLKLDFSRVTFSADCAELAGWAGKAVIAQAHILQTVAENNHLTMGRTAMSRILLSEHLLDAFFEWGLGKTLPYAGGMYKKITLCEGMLRVRFTVSPRRDQTGFIGVSVLGKVPVIQFTDRYAYYIEDDRFMRCTAEELRPIRRILETVDMSGNVAFTIGRNDLPGFYHQVLPTLRECAEVIEEEPEAVVPYVPPKPGFVFCLDYQNGTVMMRPLAVYGETEYPLYDGDMLQRDAGAESRVADKIAPLFTEWDAVTKEYVLEADEERLYRFLTEDLDMLAELGEIRATDRFSALRVRRRWKLSAGVRLESGVLDLRLLSDELSQEELTELLSAYAAKKRYHRLKDGSFISMEQNELDQLDALFEAAHVPLKEFISGHMHLPQYRALYLDRVLEEHDGIISQRSRHFRELIKSFKTISDSDYEPPESLAGVLRPYQRAGYQWLMTLYECGFGGILADDMGLGKTLQMIALFEQLRLTRPETTQLVICPTSLVYNWIDELHRFAPEIKALAVAGTRGAREALLSQAGNQHVLVTSYDQFKRDVADYEALNIHVAVLDEAQFIKNQASAAAKSVKALRCAHRFAMTGTPVENRLSELWSIFDFLMPGFLYGYETFRRELESPIVKREDAYARERLRRMVSPFILRRLKKDVLRDLPDKNEERRRVALDGKQRRLYDAQVLKLKHLLDEETEEGFRRSKLQVLAELTRLRQICCDPSLLYDDYADGSAKREALMDLLHTAVSGGHKVLVFSQFTSMLSLIEQDIRAEGFTYMLLTGDTDKKERLRMANAFNTDGTDLFLISLRAGGTGLNLVGADIVIHYDPWWNLAVEQQATDRAHRIGQTRAVTVYKLIAKDTVEERIIALQDSKRDLAEGILSGEGVSLKDLSKEDLMELIGS